jgi:transcriptional regulator with XRE-family HTH domain
MLPQANSPDFPEALKKARESKGLNYTQLAKMSRISPVMPARYENRDNANFGTPNQKTWEMLNKVLFDTELPDFDDNGEDKLLKDASMDELIHELKIRYAVTSITITP